MIFLAKGEFTPREESINFREKKRFAASQRFALL